MARFIVGSNIPGYLPECDPVECEDADNALQMLVYDIEASLIEMPDDQLMKLQPNAPNALDAYYGVVNAAKGLAQRNLTLTGEASVAVGQYVYWIHRPTVL